MTAQAARLMRARRARRLPTAHDGFGYSRDMSDPEPMAVPAGVELVCLDSRGGAR
ncbi:hypothetical protein FHR83_006762 [Actinoplanes campanulatus]|uniref:Uncharacterized protein n=1 Tax=Actinoplanes campanulatus TaxID=113559 RepID=A0A7W5FHW1_9ACTN|nr:hypothetical protein [Actinoplanes campanulatus]GGN39234.1 hypothetical protein GCM10010109_66950 [Actinoplanes campanulatus]GID40214.1 hypothetical protein Aca09nite_67200 [Actinoplanes campanulatus]